MRTNRPDAPAAIADAAFFRSRGNFHAAMQPASWKRPFKATISMDFRPPFRRVMFELKRAVGQRNQIIACRWSPCGVELAARINLIRHAIKDR
ncbi:hypothetical protein Z949_2704 [Sulfitobacter guttiformis KCTC 32187]|jgi:hypothetical protein|nr:hypothetical protein Z949_2704 [Sulfitobacter guttiformis KCTC 32187]